MSGFFDPIFEKGISIVRAGFGPLIEIDRSEAEERGGEII